MSIECPVTLSELKNHLKVETDDTDDDVLIAQLGRAATEWAERYQKRTYMSRTRTLKLDSFVAVIQVPHPPLSSVTSIAYVDTDGDSQTLSSDVYRVDTTSEPARITLEYNESWPDTQAVTNAVTVTYVAGYSTRADVPDDVKAAIKLLVGHLYEHRETVSEIILREVPFAAQALLDHERIVLPCS